MIQDIYPHVLKNMYTPRPPVPGDYLLVFSNDMILLAGSKSAPQLPCLGQTKASVGNLLYLLTIDDRAVYLADTADVAESGLTPHDIRVLRSFQPQHLAFAAVTGAQLYRWYKSRRYCGQCGEPMVHSETERAMCCKACGLTEYPKISPAVIVGVIDGERLLLTKYAGRVYKRFALIAGFMEIGETLEETVCREVMEEVGVKVKNVVYYKSQPWPFTDSLLVGFFCELDGEDTITLDTRELSVGQWISRKDLQPRDSDISLTSEMIEMFRLGNI